MGHAVPHYRSFADVFDTPFVRGWAFHQHVCRIINARCNAANSFIVLSTFVTSETVRDTDADDERHSKNRRESLRRRKHAAAGISARMNKNKHPRQREMKSYSVTLKCPRGAEGRTDGANRKGRDRKTVARARNEERKEEGTTSSVTRSSITGNAADTWSTPSTNTKDQSRSPTGYGFRTRTIFLFFQNIP